MFLAPLTLFGYEIEDLLSAHPNGLPINAVVPTYKERFGKSFQISKYGVPKLLKALEAITDVIEVSCLNGRVLICNFDKYLTLNSNFAA